MGFGEMSISGFARRTLLSIKALRLYDEMGLLRPDRIDASSGYRYYSESQIERARLISLLRKLEVPLAEIATIVDAAPSHASANLERWWRDEEERFSARRDLHRFIRNTILEDTEAQEHCSEHYEVRVRSVSEATLLHRSGHVHGPDLPAFIHRTGIELGSRANVYGGAVGFDIVIYHGVVDLDSDGPVDVCLPVGAGSVAEGGDQIRVESAHLQAYITLKRHQVAFPQILQVYQALRRWINANGYVPAGPPREMYLEDFVLADHDTLICDVAFPIISTEGAEP